MENNNCFKQRLKSFCGISKNTFLKNQFLLMIQNQFRVISPRWETSKQQNRRKSKKKQNTKWSDIWEKFCHHQFFYDQNRLGPPAKTIPKMKFQFFVFFVDFQVYVLQSSTIYLTFGFRAEFKKNVKSENIYFSPTFSFFS